MTAPHPPHSGGATVTSDPAAVTFVELGTGAAPAKPPRRRKHQNRLIRASAGTGKTFTLAHEYIDRLRDTSPEKILASTFTKKAAAEILERVLLTLAQAATDPEALARTAAQLKPPLLSQRQCLTLLQNLTRDLHRVRIGTLDSFFIQLAQSCALELGLPPGWRIIDNVELDEVQTRALEQFLHDHEPGDVVRLMHLLSKGDSARSVTALISRAVNNFYNAWRDTPRDAWHCVPPQTLLPPEAIAEALLQIEQAPRPQTKHWTKCHQDLLDFCNAEDWDAFLGLTLTRKIADGEEKYDRKPIPPEVVAGYTALTGHARGVILKHLASQTEGTWDLLNRFHAVMSRQMDDAHAATFSDVARALADGAAQLKPELVEHRLDTGVEHLLLDEFQDTSLLQWSVLRPMAQRVAAAGGNGHSFFCVGDPKQSIYGWRGGVAALFDALDGHLQELCHDSLVKSFRSAPPVIEAVNTIFRNIHQHPGLDRYSNTVSQWVQRFEDHETHWTDRPGYVALETAPNEEQDAFIPFVARRIAELHASAPSKSIAVLTRTNAGVAEIARALRQRGVPASEEGGNAPTDCIAVRHVLALMQFADHPGDAAARFAIAHSPLNAVVGPVDPADDFQAERLAQALRRKLAEEGYGRCIEDYARALAPSCDPRGVARLTQLVDLAQAYDARATLRPADFVAFVESQRLEQPSAAAVRVMTVHQSKGLQFDIVVLPELDCKLIPTTPEFVVGSPTPVDPPDAVLRYRKESIQKLLPERLQRVFEQAQASTIEGALCLMYVALTRAVHALHMLTVPTEKKPSKTYAGLIRAALTDGGPLPAASVIWQCGDPNWTQSLPEKSEVAADAVKPDAAAAQQPLEIRLAAPRDGSIQVLEPVTPSKHVKRGVRLSQIIRPANAAAMTRGTLIHAWFEQIDWLDDGRPDEVELRTIATRLGADEKEVARLLDEFQHMLRQESLAWLLSRKSYQPPRDLGFSKDAIKELSAPDVTLDVRNERRLAVPHQGQLIRGTIDRLVLLQRGGKTLAADIIDYKTDAIDGVPAAALEEKLEHYREQLRLYARAVSAIYDLPPDRIAARLVLLGAGRIERVHQ